MLRLNQAEALPDVLALGGDVEVRPARTINHWPEYAEVEGAAAVSGLEEVTAGEGGWGNGGKRKEP